VTFAVKSLFIVTPLGRGTHGERGESQGRGKIAKIAGIAKDCQDFHAGLNFGNRGNFY
jgi:hypothetical protein